SWARGRAGGRARAGRRPREGGSRGAAARGRTARREGWLLRASLSYVRLRSRADGRARRAATHLAVDDCGGDDQEPLEDVLPFLVEAEEDGRVEDLNAEPGAHERADERASPAEQARPAEHDCRDRRQGVVLSLSGVADPELR